MARSLRHDGGSISAFLVVMAMTLVLVAGLVLDGGRMLAARREVQDVAQNAARAGAQAVSLSAARNGVTTIDTAQASAAASSYLALTGHTGTSQVAGDTITVTVTDTVPMLLLSLAGIPSRTTSAVEQARIVQGVSGADS